MTISSDSENWWDEKDLNEKGELQYTWAAKGLSLQALRNGKIVSQYACSGHFAKGKDLAQLLAKIEDVGGELRLKSPPIHTNLNNTSDDYIFVWPDGFLGMSYIKKGAEVSMSTATTSLLMATSFREICEEFVVRRTSSAGHIYVVTASADGTKLTPVGSGKETLVEENYTPEVIESFRHVIEDLKSETPCGRIVIFNGPTGTGKTFLVSAMLDLVPKATFVMLPSQMISSISEPNFIQLLMNEQRKDSPIVLVIEDADSCLAARMADNVSAVSTLLNFSDGMLGKLLNIRIVVSTNVAMREVDEAVKRPGRLCRRLDVDRMDKERAQTVYKRLTSKEDASGLSQSNYYSLAEVYKAAREAGWTPPPPAARMGFRQEESLFEAQEEYQRSLATIAESFDMEEDEFEEYAQYELTGLPEDDSTRT